MRSMSLLFDKGHSEGGKGCVQVTINSSLMKGMFPACFKETLIKNPLLDPNMSQHMCVFKLLNKKVFIGE